MNKLNIWWKLAIVSVIINIIAFPGWVFLHLTENPVELPVPLYWIIVFRALLAIPLLYFTIFCIWHWRTRYAGQKHLVWPILFVFTYWPMIYATVPGSFFIVIVYFFLHILPDIKGKGIYATPPVIICSPPASSLPESYQLVKLSCFVVGLILIVFGIIVAAASCLSHFVIWNIFAERIPELVGEPFTENTSDALLLAVNTSKISVVTSLLAALAAAIGAILLYCSQRIRWRLLEKKALSNEATPESPPVMLTQMR